IRSGDLVALDTAANISPLDKIIVAFAGPLFSLGLAFVFAFIVWGVGKPENKADDTTVVGWVDPAGPAGLAGLRPGDKIIAVDGHPVKNFMPSGALSDSVKWRIITSTGTNIPITYIRDNQVLKAFPVPTNLPTKWYERKSLRQISISPKEKIMIGEIASNSPADLAGLKPGDEVVGMNGQKIYSFNAVLTAQDAISNNPTKAITLSIKRGGESFERSLLAIKPVQPTNIPPLLGIMSWYGDTNVTIGHPNPLEQISASASQIFSTIGALFEPKGQVSVQQLGGAVMIGRVYYSLFQDDQGYRRVLWFSVILNVNLALLNLLPLPVLDGGHITLSLIEVIRRRPVSARVMNAIQSGFAILLIGFMVYIAFFDTGDWIRSARANREEHIIFAPANPAAPVSAVEHGQVITIPPAK
ncbi:MAG TPA: site-2 protease family protein, partial [Verrucomicrobiae bacterium]